MPHMLCVVYTYKRLYTLNVCPCKNVMSEEAYSLTVISYSC